MLKQIFFLFTGVHSLSLLLQFFLLPLLLVLCVSRLFRLNFVCFFSLCCLPRGMFYCEILLSCENIVVDAMFFGRNMLKLGELIEKRKCKSGIIIGIFPTPLRRCVFHWCEKRIHQPKSTQNWRDNNKRRWFIWKWIKFSFLHSPAPTTADNETRERRRICLCIFTKGSNRLDCLVIPTKYCFENISGKSFIVRSVLLYCLHRADISIRHKTSACTYARQSWLCVVI